MSASLEVYAVSWRDVSAAIGSLDSRLFGQILSRADADFEEVFEPIDFADGPDYELGLERWIQGEVERPAADEVVTIDNLGDALGFVAIVRFHAALVGSVQYASISGDAFRQQFLLGTLQQLLRPSYGFEHLISRPIAGYESEDFPFWGGLTRAELRELAPALQGAAPVWEADPDIDAWLADLWPCLQGCLEADKDLVTIFA